MEMTGHHPREDRCENNGCQNGDHVSLELDRTHDGTLLRSMSSSIASLVLQGRRGVEIFSGHSGFVVDKICCLTIVFASAMILYPAARIYGE